MALSTTSCCIHNTPIHRTWSLPCPACAFRWRHEAGATPTPVILDNTVTELIFNAFVMNTSSHIQHGLWRHPEARQADFDDVKVWIDLAKTLEAGLFDAIFFADVVGLYGPLHGDYAVN